MSVLRENKASRFIWAVALLVGAFTTVSVLTDCALFDSSGAGRAVQSWAAPLQFNAFAIAAIPPR
jgi:hypothetical protein